MIQRLSLTYNEVIAQVDCQTLLEILTVMDTIDGRLSSYETHINNMIHILKQDNPSAALVEIVLREGINPVENAIAFIEGQKA